MLNVIQSAVLAIAEVASSSLQLCEQTDLKLKFFNVLMYIYIIHMQGII